MLERYQPIGPIYDDITYSYNTMPQYYSSQCGQDEFVHQILERESHGYFVDIGASHPIEYSNSYTLECIGWKGLCFDIEEQDDFSKIRKSKLIVGNAVDHDYVDIFTKEKVPNIVEYLSVDVDEDTLNVLEKIPLHDFKFKVITIEHDYYRFGDKLRERQRELLNKFGYHLVCSNVDPDCSQQYFFEDWWINPTFIDVEKCKRFECHQECYRNIVKRFYEF
jgi:hypothetical protein